MRLDVSKALVAEGRSIPFSVTVDLPQTVLMGEDVSFPSPARLEGGYTSVGDTIHVQGMLRFEALSHCVRCLREASKPFVVPFSALYALQADEEDPDIYTYDGAWIDLTDMASDMALLALPMQWLCGEDCSGLCPLCGTDRNLTQCSCRVEDAQEHPFAALQQLLTKDESEV